jgi:hypothetical protein
MKDVVEVELVDMRLVVVAFVEMRLVSVEERAVRSVAKRLEEVVVASEVLPENVLSPTKVWVVVETTPRAVGPALGMLRVWVVPVEVIVISEPVCPTAKNWEIPVRPLRVVIPAPAIPRALQVDPL